VKDDVTPKRLRKKTIRPWHRCQWVESSAEDYLHAVAASEAEQGDWSGLAELLNFGSQQPQGIRLTPAECWILRGFVRGTRKWRRVKQFGPKDRALNMGLYCLLLELDGRSTESAVASTAKAFGAKRSTDASYEAMRSTVFAARRRMQKKLPNLEHIHPSPERSSSGPSRKTSRFSEPTKKPSPTSAVDSPPPRRLKRHSP
jgi:hypothetical protein